MAAADHELAVSPTETQQLADETSGVDAPIISITAEPRLHVPFRELWEFRELLFFLTCRDIKVRYKQTVIGAAWAVIQPLVTMLIFTAIFHRFAKIATGDVPYPIFAYAGLLPWHLFAGALQRSIHSVVSSTPLITKVYFPRLILPIAATLSATVDFAIAFVVLVVMAVGFGIMPTWRIIALPGAVGLVLLSALAVGLWLSAANVRYRDVGHAVPFLVQVWMLGSPVAYPVTLVPERWQILYSLNPMVGAIEAFRWAFFGMPAPDIWAIVMSGSMMLLLMVLGLLFFRRMERTFADVI